MIEAEVLTQVPTAGRGRLRLVEYTDPYSIWCWGCEPAIRRVEWVYAGSVDLEIRMGGLFEDFTPMREQFSRMSGGKWKDSVLAFMDAVAEHHRIPDVRLREERCLPADRGLAALGGPRRHPPEGGPHAAAEGDAGDARERDRAAPALRPMRDLGGRRRVRRDGRRGGVAPRGSRCRREGGSLGGRERGDVGI